MHVGTSVVTDQGVGFYFDDRLIWVGTHFPLDPISWFSGENVDRTSFLVDPGDPPDGQIILEWKKGNRIADKLGDVSNLHRCVSDTLVTECVEDYDALTGRLQDICLRSLWMSPEATSIAFESLADDTEKIEDRWNRYWDVHGDYLGTEQYARIERARNRWSNAFEEVDKIASVG